MTVPENMANLGENSGVSQKIPVREINLKQMVETLLDGLSAKQKLVIASRFGIAGGEGKTLEAIGKSLNITRERVRQIETDAIRILRKTEKQNGARDITQSVKEIAKDYGGIIAGERLTKEMFARFFGRSDFSKDEERLAEVLFLFSGLTKNKSNRETSDSWKSFDFDQKYFRALAEELDKIFEAEEKTLEAEKVLQKISYSDFVQRYPKFIPEHAISALEVLKKFGQNVFRDWGKAKWPLISPRGVREKATLVLLKQGKPLHFREISKLVEEFGMSKKKVHPQTVHNELIRDKRFVLVGRGTYALREWGYEEGTVKDVITGLLRMAGGFLSREKLYQGVLKKRHVKKATIAVNLADKKIFEKISGGYRLKTN